MATLLKAAERDHEEWESVESSYTLHSEETDTYVDGERSRQRLFISQPFLWEPSIDDIHLSFDAFEAPCGEDCEECLIPEEYKLVSSEEAIDVMAFLGIRRAEPLQASRPSREWE